MEYYHDLNLSSAQLSRIKIESVFSLSIFFLFFFTVLAIFICFLILSRYNLQSINIFSNYSVEVEGKIIDVQKLGWPFDEVTYQYDYQYQVNGKKIESYAYGEEGKHEINDTVLILVDKWFYTNSILPGLEKSIIPVWGLIILLPPFFLIYFCVYVVKELKGMFKILENGVLTKGWHVKSTELHPFSDDRAFKHDYMFKDKSGKAISISLRDTNEECEKNVRIIFDKTNPEEAFIYDNSRSGTLGKAIPEIF